MLLVVIIIAFILYIFLAAMCGYFYVRKEMKYCWYSFLFAIIDLISGLTILFYWFEKGMKI